MWCAHPRDLGPAISRALHIFALLTAAASLLPMEARAEAPEDLTEISTDLTEGDDLTDQEEVVADEDVFPEEVDLATLGFWERLAQLRPRLALSQAFVADSDFGSQEVDTYITELRGSVGAPLTRHFGVRLVGSGGISVYDFHGDDDFLYTGRNSGVPFDDLVSNLFRLEGIYRVNDAWRLLGGTYMTSRFETGVRYADGIEGGGFAAAGYHWGEDLTIVLGLAVGSRMDRSGPGFSPVFRVEWKVTDDVEIQTEGLGLRVGTRLNDHFSLTLGTGFQGSRYRLGDRSGFVEPGVPASGRVGKGSLRDRRLHVVGGLVWRPGGPWRVRTSLGMVPYQQYTTKDHDGHTLDKSTIEKPAFASAISLEYRF